MSATEDRARTGATIDAQGDAASRTFAHERGEGEALWWIGMLATIKATAEQTGGRYTLVEVLAPDGFASPLHVHHYEDEGFWILEGEMTFYVGDQTIKARSGSFLFGPKVVPHAFTVDSGPARLLFVLSPAGFEGLVREMGEPARELTIPPQPEGPPDTGTRYSGHRRGSRSAWLSLVRAEATKNFGPFPCPLFTRVRGRGVPGKPDAGPA